MNKTLKLTFFLLMALLIMPGTAGAYSYGDPNEEEVAETFKLVIAKLSESTSDWDSALAAYKVRRSEISAHFGASVATTLDKNFSAKDKNAVISNFKAVLVMNLDRRFEYAIKDINDYTKVKLLLTKAKSTYETLEPYIDDTDKVKTAKQDFEVALEALGNPGLFGVGEKEAEPAVFKEKVTSIYSSVKSMFPFKAASTTGGGTATKPTPKPTPKPATTKPTPKPTTSTTKPVVKPVVPAPTPEEVKPAETTVAATEPAVEPAQVSVVDPATDPATTDPASEPVSAEVTPDTVTDAASTEKTPDEAAVDTKAEQTQEPITEAAHAPMERTDKTNSLLTFSLIGGLIVIIAGTLVFLRKKKYI